MCDGFDDTYIMMWSCNDVMNASDSLPTKAKELRALLLAERALHAQERARHAKELSAERNAKDHAQDEMKRWTSSRSSSATNLAGAPNGLISIS